MAAVSTLIDRIYRDFLNKPDDLSAFSRLDGAINDSVTSLNYEAGLFSVEEENLLGSGALIEINQEIMLVTSANVLPDVTFVVVTLYKEGYNLTMLSPTASKTVLRGNVGFTKILSLSL